MDEPAHHVPDQSGNSNANGNDNDGDGLGRGQQHSVLTDANDDGDATSDDPAPALASPQAQAQAQTHEPVLEANMYASMSGALRQDDWGYPVVVAPEEGQEEGQEEEEGGKGEKQAQAQAPTAEAHAEQRPQERDHDMPDISDDHEEWWMASRGVMDEEALRTLDLAVGGLARLEHDDLLDGSNGKYNDSEDDAFAKGHETANAEGDDIEEQRGAEQHDGQHASSGSSAATPALIAQQLISAHDSGAETPRSDAPDAPDDTLRRKRRTAAEMLSAAADSILLSDEYADRSKRRRIGTSSSPPKVDISERLMGSVVDDAEANKPHPTLEVLVPDGKAVKGEYMTVQLPPEKKRRTRRPGPKPGKARRRPSKAELAKIAKAEAAQVAKEKAAQAKAEKRKKEVTDGRVTKAKAAPSKGDEAAAAAAKKNDTRSTRTSTRSAAQEQKSEVKTRGVRGRSPVKVSKAGKAGQSAGKSAGKAPGKTAAGMKTKVKSTPVPRRRGVRMG
ncbi:hypothetical protein GMORB2_7313 [Geosmithia morbida]|uniref:Uncharacterized protein n=1 Tax=Geosmithia morbida TaxID=1094350 RepID=A0A9P4YV74_9HYPO|nr:uncharacterized protein GMORB2_7313 [Geosmithia morbida]KAF4122321.1 hypothetical protein GMORB2_7313 [Geosmithia morbida]